MTDALGSRFPADQEHRRESAARDAAIIAATPADDADLDELAGHAARVELDDLD